MRKGTKKDGKHCKPLKGVYTAELQISMQT